MNRIYYWGEGGSWLVSFQFWNTQVNEMNIMYATSNTTYFCQSKVFLNFIDDSLFYLFSFVYRGWMFLFCPFSSCVLYVANFSVLPISLDWPLFLLPLRNSQRLLSTTWFFVRNICFSHYKNPHYPIWKRKVIRNIKTNYKALKSVLLPNHNGYIRNWRRYYKIILIRIGL